MADLFRQVFDEGAEREGAEERVVVGAAHVGQDEFRFLLDLAFVHGHRNLASVHDSSLKGLRTIM